MISNIRLKNFFGFATPRLLAAGVLLSAAGWGALMTMLVITAFSHPSTATFAAPGILLAGTYAVKLVIDFLNHEKAQAQAITDTVARKLSVEYAWAREAEMQAKYGALKAAMGAQASPPSVANQISQSNHNKPRS